MSDQYGQRFKVIDIMKGGEDGWDIEVVAASDYDRLTADNKHLTRGTFACPICGVDTPHGHPEEAIRRHRNGELQAGPLSRDTMQLLEDAKNGVHGEMAREVLDRKSVV